MCCSEALLSFGHIEAGAFFLANLILQPESRISIHCVLSLVLQPLLVDLVIDAKSEDTWYKAK